MRLGTALAQAIEGLCPFILWRVNMRKRILSPILVTVVLGLAQLACSDLIKDAQNSDNNAGQTASQDPTKDLKQTLESEKKDIQMSLLQKLTYGKWQNCNKLVTGGYLLTEVGYHIDGKRPLKQKIYKDAECSVEFTQEEVEAIGPADEMRDLYSKGVSKVERFKISKIVGNVADVEFPNEMGSAFTKIKVEADKLIVAVCEKKEDLCGTSAADRASSFVNAYEFKFVKKSN